MTVAKEGPAERRPRPWARPIILWIGRRCLSWFFREWRVFGFGQVPPTGPVLLIGNHPNDIPDVLLGFYTTPRHVRYVATLSAAGNWLSQKTYEGLGVIPVARVRDARTLRARGVDMVALNQAAGTAVVQALHNGDLVGMFPQGGVHDTPYIGKLRSGVASMALQYIDADVKHDVTVVPFGVQYEAPHRRGSEAYVVVGAPFSLRSWREARTSELAGPAHLSERFREALLSVTRNAASWEQATERDELIAAAAGAAAAGAAAAGAAAGANDPLQAAVALVHPAQALIDSANSEAPTHSARPLREMSHALARAVERAGGIGSSAVDQARLRYALGLQSTGAPPAFWPLIAGALPALMGGAVHLPVWTALQWWARKYQTARTDIPARCFLPGLYWVVGWWLLCALMASVALALLGQSTMRALLAAVVVLLVLPRLGDMALRWGRGWAARRMVARVRGWPSAEQEKVRQIAETFAQQWSEQARV